MTDTGFLALQKTGKSTNYVLNLKGRIFADIDSRTYTAVEPDKCYGLSGYNFDLLKNFPTNLFTNEKLKKLETASTEYKERKEPRVFLPMHYYFLIHLLLFLAEH